MKIVFMGTPEFSVATLKKLHKSEHEVLAVVTAPDRPAGRGLNLKVSAVKEYALSINVPILQPKNLKSPDFINKLKELKADLNIVVAFRMLPELVWDLPRLGSINLHASLLPQYRGAAPINWAIINQEKETGLSTFFIKQKIDTGNILLQEKCKIEIDETAGSLHDKLMIKGAALVIKTLNNITSDNCSTLPQEEAGDMKKAPKIFKDDCQISWKNSAIEIDHFIRGLNPYPIAWTAINNKILRVYKGRISDVSLNLKPGELICKDKKLIVGTKDGIFEILILQLEGKKKISSNEFINGLNINKSIYLK